jgi:uncharacterized protein (TIGR03435 family)
MLRTATAILFLLSSTPASGQSPSAPLSFEVADVKVNKSGDLQISADLKNGRVAVHNAPMKLLITAAYHIPPNALEGGPGWLETDRFDVVAKAAATTSEADLRLMLRTLLADRFKLAIHQDQKSMPAWVLTVGKAGPKLQQSDAAKPGDQRCAPGQGTPGDQHIVCQHMTMGDLVDNLPAIAPGYVRDTPVVDQTGLKGSYEFKLDWTPAGRLNAAAGSPDGTAAISLFDALEAQLGLKLENRKIPLPIVVIDHIDRVPSEN